MAEIWVNEIFYYYLLDGSRHSYWAGRIGRMRTFLYRFLAYSLVVGVLTGLQWPGVDAINLAPRFLQRNTRQTGHNHGSSAVHEEEEAQECPLNASLLTLAFNEVAMEMNVTGLNGILCSLPVPECDHHDDDHHDGEHHDDNDDHGNGDHDDKHEEDHDGSGSASTDSQCLSIYNVCKELMAHTNLTTHSCLDQVCEEEHNITDDSSSSSHKPSKAEAYGYGFLMVILVSLGSLLGILVVPLIDTDKNKRKDKKQSKKHIVYKYIYFFMIALGTSALLTDAVLHLLPHAWGLHAHEEEDAHGHSSSHGTVVEDFVWKGSVTLLAIYIFYLMEYGLHFWSNNSHSHGFPIHGDDDLQPETISLDVTVPHGPCVPNHHDGHIIHPGQADRESEREMESGRGSREAFFKEKVEEQGKQQEEEEGDVSSSNGFNGLVPTHEELPKKSKQPKMCSWLLQIKPLAWLIILGDGLHNFADGLALGAAVSQSLALGIGTTVALLFHEIPHEFGDYVILLSTGLSWYSALLFNFFSSLSAVIGFFIGVAIGTESETVNNWILAFAAGSFVYIALVDLLPELIHSKESGTHRCGLFLASNVGFHISFFTLFFLAVYEEDLNNLIE